MWIAVTRKKPTNYDRYSVPTREGYELKRQYREMYLLWMSAYNGGNCSCHINPPCSCCTDEGNPNNLMENDDAWVKV